MAWWKPFGYLLIIVTATALPRAAALGEYSGMPDLFAFFQLIALFVITPLLDHAIGHDTRNPRDDVEARALDAAPGYRWLTMACLPVYLLLLIWSAHEFATMALSPVGQLGWILSQGVVGGVLAINVAHELIHRSSRVESSFGGALLACVCYGGFKVEHLRGHHVQVATAADTSSAPYGMNAYHFVGRSLWRNPVSAWQLEARRLGARGLPLWSHHNELLWWHGLSLVLLGGFFLAFGLAGAVFFIGQSLIAIAMLEVINYIEHYGLVRRIGPDGRPERTTHLHSWNSSFLLSNLILLQLQRHSDHHAHAGRRYQSLRHHPDAPQLPSGYPGMFLVALVPPLWFALMNPRVEAWRRRVEFAEDRKVTAI